MIEKPRARMLLASAGAAALLSVGSSRPPTRPAEAGMEVVESRPAVSAITFKAETARSERANAVRMVLPVTRPAFHVTKAAAAQELDSRVRVAASDPPILLLDILAAAPLVVVEPQSDPNAASPAEVLQLAYEAESSVYVTQLNEPSADLAVNLSDRVAAMQVTLPPPARLSRTEQAALLAEAPDRLDVRRGGSTIGSLAVRVAPTRAVTVELGGVLALVQSEMSPAEYARLRESAAATAFVPLETLRAAGIDLRYDPVYDEFRLAA